MWNICSSLQKFLYRILHRHTRNWYFSLMNISHNLLIHYFSRDWKKSYGMLPPIHNLVNRYHRWPPPRIPKQALQHEAKLNSSPKSSKLDLCVTTAQPWKTPRMSHQKKLYASVYIVGNDVVFSRFGAFHTVLSYIKPVTRMKIFPTSTKPNPLFSYHFLWNTLRNSLFVTRKIITTLARETTCRIFSFHTDTHNAGSWQKQHRR